MKKLSLLFIGLFAVTAIFAQSLKEVVTISSNITANATWTANKVYLLKGIVKIENGVTLTVEPGTVVKGGQAADGSKATCLLVDKGAKLIAIGTAEKPIVFTSGQPKGERGYGDWGGIVMFGNAPGNKTNPQYEGGVIPGTYGGNNPADNSGTLKYVRIEFAGFPFEQDRELNSLTMCGVGNGTSIDYVQCSYNNDDAFEWFGGTVNAKHLVAFKTNDDCWDVDQGFSGNIQFGVSIADPTIADISTKNGFEVDNDAGGTNEGPKTSAVFSNMTVIGAFKDTSDVRDPLHGRGGHLRRNNQISIFNTIIMGWREGIRMDGANTFANFRGNVGFMQNIIFAGHKRNFNGAAGVTAADFQTFFDSTGNNNRKFNLNSEVMLEDAFNFTAPNFRPKTGSPALTGGSFTNSKISGSFFTPTTYVGAFGSEDWTATWTEFDPINAEYDSIYPTTSINKVENVLNYSVYPNPATENVSISFDLLNSNEVSVQVIDINGKIVSETITETFAAGSNKIDIATANLSQGMYLVKFQTAETSLTTRLVVAK